MQTYRKADVNLIAVEAGYRTRIHHLKINRLLNNLREHDFTSYPNYLS